MQMVRIFKKEEGKYELGHFYETVKERSLASPVLWKRIKKLTAYDHACSQFSQFSTAQPEGSRKKEGKKKEEERS